MHDKYYYEAAEMALYDTNAFRFFATGIAGLSVAADSLSAIKYAKVKPKYNGNQLIGFDIKGDFPKYGNDDDRVDKIAVELVKFFMTQIRKNKTYRNSLATMSILTITSNVVYGKATGDTPDGRKAGEPFAPGANPMHGRDVNGAVSSLNSVAKLPFKYAADGISNTFSIIPNALGKDSLGVISGSSLSCEGPGCNIIDANEFVKNVKINSGTKNYLVVAKNKSSKKITKKEKRSGNKIEMKSTKKKNKITTKTPSAKKGSVVKTSTTSKNKRKVVTSVVSKRNNLNKSKNKNNDLIMSKKQNISSSLPKNSDISNLHKIHISNMGENNKEETKKTKKTSIKTDINYE